MCAKYRRGFSYVDGSMANPGNYTALASVYFVGDNIASLQIYDFSKEEYRDVTCVEICSKPDSNLINKKHFPPHLQMNTNPSRKGFIHTAWKIDQQIFHFVNIHLFHDESNLVSIHSSPSIYALQRKRALHYAIESLGKHLGEMVGDHVDKLFFFGDFNFRLDSNSFLGDHYSSKDPSCHCFVDGDSQRTIEVLEKTFKFRDPGGKALLLTDLDWRNLLKYDKEITSFESSLEELPINFPPSYVYSESEDSHGSQLGDKRCPSWCDRILYNKPVGQLFLQSQEITYGIVGMDMVVGDHKPVYMIFEIPSSLGNRSEHPLRVVVNECDCNDSIRIDLNINVD